MVAHMIARLLQDQFIKESTVLHEKMKQKQLQIAAGWYSKAEMSDQLNWDEYCPQQTFQETMPIKHHWCDHVSCTDSNPFVEACLKDS